MLGGSYKANTLCDKEWKELPRTGSPPVSDELGRSLFILVVIIFVGWFALGTQLNIRKGNKVLRWLQAGLTLVGEKTTLRWLGSSAVELKVQKAQEPLQQVEIFVVLEPRDLPFLWWFFRARGRRDLLIVRSQLRSTPRFELEVLDTDAWSTRGIKHEVQGKQWTPVATGRQSSLVAYTRGGIEAASALLSLIPLSELSLVRLAVHRTAPNLEVQWRLGDFERVPARRVFETVHRIVAEL